MQLNRECTRKLVETKRQIRLAAKHGGKVHDRSESETAHGKVDGEKVLSKRHLVKGEKAHDKAEDEGKSKCAEEGTGILPKKRSDATEQVAEN